MLAAYVSIDVVRALVGTGEADRSLPGIVLAALSLAVMPFLSAAQRRAGRELGSASAVADSKQTLLCMNISLQAALTAVQCSDTGQAIDKRGRRWTGCGREGSLPAC